MVLIPSRNRWHARLREIAFEPAQLIEGPLPQPLYADRKYKLLSAPRLVPGKNGRGGFQESIASGTQYRRVRTLVSEEALVREPPGIERTQSAVQYLW